MLDKLRATYLPADRDTPAPGEPMPLANIIAVAVIAFVLSGGLSYLLPGAAYQEELDQSRTAIERDTWRIDIEGGNCQVYMPHGEKRCAYGNLDGSTIAMRGY